MWECLLCMAVVKDRGLFEPWRAEIGCMFV